MQATCGHQYCLSCFADYYKAQGEIQLQCPLCRAPISFLFTNYQNAPPELADADQRVKDYNFYYNEDQRSVGWRSE